MLVKDHVNFIFALLTRKVNVYKMLPSKNVSTVFMYCHIDTTKYITVYLPKCLRNGLGY